MLKLLKNLGKKEWLYITIGIIFILIQVWLELKMPEYMSTITRLVQTQGSKMQEILQNGGLMLLCALGSMICHIITGYLFANVSAKFSFNTRKKVFDKVENLAMHEVNEFSTSSLITRTTNDITQMQMAIGMGIQLLVKAPITAIWAVTKILNKSWQWSTITGVGVIIVLTTISILMSIVIPRFKKIQKLIDKINGLTRENLIGIRVIRAFNAEKYQEDKFENTNEELTKTQIFTQKAMSLMSPIMYLVMYFLTLSIYFVGARMIDSAQMVDKLPLFSDMIVFSSYAMQVITSFLMLSMIFMMVPRAQVSANRINEVIDAKITIRDGKIDSDKNNKKGIVEFKNVSFKYPDADEYLLKNISFKAEKGQTVAFIGATGSGKTTLINLIPRLYDVTEGEVLVDEVNVKEYTQEYLHNKIGYVSQKAVMFDNSVLENVSYGEALLEISEENAKKAIEIAQAKQFVEKMDEGYETHIASGGTNISGGQKQRLSIARAVARKPEIYIFDDSFSALDYKTDRSLRQALKEYTKDVTTIIVAQRIGTIMNADKILVLDQGKIVGEGTHKELLQNCEIYKEIALSQLSIEEL